MLNLKNLCLFVLTVFYKYPIPQFTMASVCRMMKILNDRDQTPI